MENVSIEKYSTAICNLMDRRRSLKGIIFINLRYFLPFGERESASFPKNN